MTGEGGVPEEIIRHFKRNRGFGQVPEVDFINKPVYVPTLPSDSKPV